MSVRDVARSVRKQSDEGVPFSDAPHLAIETIELEPVRRRSGRNQIDGGRGQRSVIGRLVPILDALMPHGTRQLIAARVRPHDVFEVLGDGDGDLTVTRADVPGECVTRAHRSQPGEELVRIARTVPGIRVSMAGKMIFVRHRFSRELSLVESLSPRRLHRH